MELQERDGVVRTQRLHIPADNPGEAVVSAKAAMTAARATSADGLYVVYRRRRTRGRTLVGVFAGQGGSDDGLAGVREPRRPLPDLPGLSAYRDVTDPDPTPSPILHRG